MEIPLIGPKHLSEFTPEEYREYVKGMHLAPEKKVRAEVLFSRTKKGNPQITVRRKPKWISEEEFKALSKMHGVKQHVLFLYLKKRKIELRRESGKEAKHV